MALPRWARLLLSSIHANRRLTYRYQVIVEELVRAFVADRDAATAAMYEGTARYRPGGDIHGGGLFAWERALVASEHFPRTGRVLVGAAGGGRELAALCELGYEVVAFEPSGLVTAAEEVAVRHPRATVVRASYADLVRAVRDRQGPLAAVTERPFDAIILGWGSISHVLEEADRLALFRALRELGPDAPVIASYIGAVDATSGLRRRVRGVARRLGGASPPEGVLLRADSGFTYIFAPGELELLARRAGYATAIHEGAPDRYALFVPTRRAG